MRKWTKIVLSAAIMLMALVLFPFGSNSADAASSASGTWGNLNWTLDNNGLLTISGSGTMQDFQESSTEAWRAYSDQITSVIVNSGVTSIGDRTLKNCRNVTSITIPDSVSSIGYAAFWGCSSLSRITIPSSVTGINNSVFFGCYELKTAGPIGGGYNYEFGWTELIPANAFKFSGLESIVLPSTIKTIGEQAFMDTRLSNVTIPASITSIGKSAFYGCSQLTGIEVEAGNPSYSVLDGVLFNRERTVLCCFPAGRTGDYTIPQSVTEIETGAFGGSTGLTGVTIPSGVTNIGASAFEGCYSLTSLTIPNSVTVIKTGTFYECKNMTSISIPAGVTSIQSSAFYSCNSLTDVYFGGTQAQWNTITNGSNNDPLASATIHYSEVPPTTYGIIDVDALIDGAAASNTSGSGVFDVYIDNVLDASGVTEYRKAWPLNTRYRIENIRASAGRYCVIAQCVGLSGTVEGDSVNPILCFITGVEPTSEWQEASVLPKNVTAENCEIEYNNHYLVKGTASPGSGWSRVAGSGVTTYENSGSIETTYIPRQTSDTYVFVDWYYYHFCGSNGRVNYYQSSEYPTYHSTTKDYLDVIGETGDDDSDDIRLYRLQWRDDSPAYAGSLATCAGDQSCWWYRAYQYQPRVAVTSYTWEKYSAWTTQKDSSADSVTYRFRLKSYTVSFDANGGETAPEPQTKTHGTALTLTTDTPSRADSNAGNYTVTLNANGGSVSPASMTAVRTTSHSFKSWNTKADGSGTSYNPGEKYTEDKGITLYAQWTGSTTTASVTLPTPTWTGHTFKGWATSSGATSGTTGNYTPTGNVTLYATWTADQSFDAAHDAYSFGNSMSAFGYTSAGPGASYPIKYDPSFTLIFGDSVAGKSKYKQAIKSRWGGNCCGMSSSTALLYSNSNVSALSFGKNDVFSLSIGDSDGSITVRTFVEAIQIAQYTDQFARDYKNNRVYTYELEAGSEKLNVLYNAVSNSLAQGKGTIIGIGKSGVGAHALLAYKLETISDSTMRMYVYDCNYPGAIRYFTLTVDSQGRFSGWTYDMGGYGVWGTEGSDGSSCFISYIPYDTIEYIWNNRGNLYDNNEMLSFSGENLSIKDFSGAEVASIVNGQLQTNRSDIYELPELSMNWSATKGIFLPKDFYTIESSDGAELELSMVDHDLGASITTSAPAVSFAVDDNTRENTVIVENATLNDSYSVSLESSFTGVKYENVVIRGTGRGESISISGDNDTLSISNCNVDSLQINGVERITYTITAYSGTGGTITPKGDTLVDVNGSKIFTITPDPGYVIDSVKIDGNEIGAVSEYEFQNVIRDHTITATFMRAYGVTEAFFDRSTNTVTADLINLASAKLVCAVYNSEGQMLTVSPKNISKNCGTATINLICGSLPSNITIKLLILDSHWRPLCSSYSFYC